MRNSILRRLAKLNLQGAVDTSVMKVHIGMRMNSTSRPLATRETIDRTTDHVIGEWALSKSRLAHRP